MILQLLGGAVSEWVGGGVVGVAYLAPKGWAALAVSVHAIDRVHQPSINLYKTNLLKLYFN